MTNTATNPKITITGTPRKFDANELMIRQQGFHNAYRSTDQCCEIVRGELPFLLLANVIAKHNQGYILTNRYPMSMGNASYHTHMIKPDDLQHSDIAAIDERVKADYIAELEAEREHYRQQLTQQLLQAAELKEAKRLADQKAKLLADIQDEVDSVFTDLVVPD